MKRISDELLGCRVVLEYPDEHLVGRSFQNARLLNRLAAETVAELAEFSAVSRNFVQGVPREQRSFDASCQQLPGQLSEKELLIGGHQVMQDWERPLMEAMARSTAQYKGTVLEIGFGLGISATEIQRMGVREHHIVDCNPDVIAQARKWAEGRDGIFLYEKLWEDAMPALGRFDGILFDPYCATWGGIEACDQGSAFHHMMEFFGIAANHLNPGGILTYFTGEIETVGRSHQRELLKHFSRFEVEVIRGMKPPEDCQYWWSDSMVMVSAVR